MMTKVLLIAIMLASIPKEHDIHVSVCEVDIKESHIEITLKTFLDDLKLAVGLVPGAELPENYTSANEMIAAYIAKSIYLQSEDHKITLSVDDFSASTDAVWITITSQNHNSVTSITMYNSFLTELYNDQRNIVNIKNGNEKKSFILDKKKKECNLVI